MVIVLLSGLLAYGLTRDATAIKSPLLERPAPDFALRTIEDGRILRLRDVQGQVVVLNFWASWCGPCREEHPNFVAAWDRYRDRPAAGLPIPNHRKLRTVMCAQTHPGPF